MLPASDRLRLVRLDVTSAQQSIARSHCRVGEIDVLVNNAEGRDAYSMPWRASARGDSQPVCHPPWERLPLTRRR